MQPSAAIPPLEQAYYLAQIVAAGVQTALLGFAIVAAVISWRQYTATTFFEVTRYTMSEGFRLARRTVIKDIEMKGLEPGWWANSKLNDAASDCASHYDMIGRAVRRRGDRNAFIESWGQSVVRTYETLLPFMEERWGPNSPALDGYRYLYEQSVKNPRVMSSLGHRPARV